MPNRETLKQHRVTLQNLDSPLSELELSVPSCLAATQIARARALVRAAEQQLAAALQQRVDGVVAGAPA